jgi:hypothetical protein
MRKLFILLFLLAGSVPAFTQDEITFRSGEILKAKIIEIGSEDITYKKAENISGPSYSVKKDKVFMIKYENGTKDLFGSDTQVTPATATSASPSSGTPATIFFYRPSKIMGSSPDITVGTFIPDEVIVSLRNGHWFKSDYTYTGQREFVTGIYSIKEEKMNVSIEPGATYYIRCSIMKGMGLQSQLEMVDEETAKKEMNGLKEQMKAK